MINENGTDTINQVLAIAIKLDVSMSINLKNIVLLTQ